MNLFSEIIYMAIVSSVIGIVILGIRKIVKNKICPKYRYLIWSIFIISLIVPVRSLGNINIYNMVNIESVKEKMQIYNNTDLPLDNGNSIIDDKILENNNFDYYNIKEIISKCYLAISGFILLKYILRYTIFLKLINNKPLHDERINKILEECKSKMNIKRKITILPQSKINTPAIFGVLNIRILMPKIILKMDDENITGIIMHELAHYKRKDNYINIIFQFAKIVYWFNPIVYICIHHIRNDIELATDEIAISKLGEKSSFKYCETMIAVAAMNSSRIMPVVGFASASEVLEERIDMIIARERFKKYSVVTGIGCIIILLIIWFTFCPSLAIGKEMPDLYININDARTVIIDNTFIKEIKINTTDELEFFINGEEKIGYVLYNKTDLKEKTNTPEMLDETTNKISYFEPGEYLYKFSIKYNNQMIDYKVKLIIE